jgi:hypothetical protein
MSQRIDVFERLSRWATWLAFSLGVLAFLASPLLAIGWAQQPFPGFMLDPTLVVDAAARPGWAGTELGLTYPQHVLRMAGQPVATAAEVRQVLSGRTVGETIPVFVEFPDGSAQLYPEIPLVEYKTGDLLAMYWVPYLIGLAYLGIGYWLYRVSGHTRPGRAISFFCACTAIASGMIFDLYTTHVAPALWTLALALAGGALLSLALRFPQEWKPVERRPWLLALPYGVSLLLALLAWIELPNLQEPWNLFPVWSSIYRFVALAIVLFLGLTAYRGGTSGSPLVRRQARIVLAGSLLAFAPVTVWFLGPVFGQTLPFTAAVFLPSLVLFPMAVGVAILRYRLWQVDSLVNKAVVYGALTAVLAGVFTALIGLSQQVFVVLTGERSEAALILTTLIVASAAAPMRTWLQVFVDRRFREAPTTSTQLVTFSQQVQAFVEMNDPQRLARRLLEESAAALGAVSGVLRVKVDGQGEVLHTLGPWRGEAMASIPLLAGQHHYGLLQLGPRQDRSGYSSAEILAVQKTAQQVAEAMHLSATGSRAKA